MNGERRTHPMKLALILVILAALHIPILHLISIHFLVVSKLHVLFPLLLVTLTRSTANCTNAWILSLTQPLSSSHQLSKHAPPSATTPQALDLLRPLRRTDHHTQPLRARRARAHEPPYRDAPHLAMRAERVHDEGAVAIVRSRSVMIALISTEYAAEQRNKETRRT